MLRRALALGLMLVALSFALFALQHRSTEGDLHVVTPIGAIECAVDDAAPPVIGGDGHPTALAGLLMLLAAVLLGVAAVWRMLPRTGPRPAAPRARPTLPSLICATPGLLRV